MLFFVDFVTFVNFVDFVTFVEFVESVEFVEFAEFADFAELAEFFLDVQSHPPWADKSEKWSSDKGIKKAPVFFRSSRSDFRRIIIS